MMIDEQTYKDLVTAFSHKLTMETNFYWKKATKRLIEVSILDYALISDCKEGYESGLDPEEEKEVKEAIIANEKKGGTHLLIPRLSIDQRIEIMNHFIRIQADPKQKQILQTTLNKIIDLKQSKPIDLLKNGFKMGFDLNNLTVNLTELLDFWIEFYRTQTKTHVDKWLSEINVSI
jgi:hypothetical protein